MKLSEFLVQAAERLHEKKAAPKPPEGWGMQPLKFKRYPKLRGVVYTLKGERKQVLRSVKLITQNVDKAGSKWAKLANEGHTVTQVEWHLKGTSGKGVVVDSKFFPYPVEPKNCV